MALLISEGRRTDKEKLANSEWHIAYWNILELDKGESDRHTGRRMVTMNDDDGRQTMNDARQKIDKE